jgi:hypothetical protein
MYTSYIGKKFLKIYREKYNKPDDYSARQFFDEELFPIFFNDDRHLMHVHGSTFFQAVGKKDLKKDESEHLFRLNRLHIDIENSKYSGSTFVGYAAGKIDQPTSGQLTSLDCKIDSEEVYASWIGQGLSIGLSGGLILIAEMEILWKLFKGWEYYRKHIFQTPHLKGRQIETWNGHWLCHTLSRNFNDVRPLDSFQLPTSQSDEEKGVISIPTQDWIKIIFALARKYPNKTITSYSYFLGKMNTTLGFINFYLPDVRRLYDLKDRIFLSEEDILLNYDDIEKLETFFTFKNACKLGTIGLKALEPAKLREFMPKGSVDYAQGKEYKFSDDNSYLSYQLYKIWIIAMLNKTELLQLASDVSAALLNFENAPNNRGKKDLATLSEAVRTSTNIKAFIDKLTGILEEKPENADVFKNVVNQVVPMPSDNFPLFVTLIRFEYTYQKSKN